MTKSFKTWTLSFSALVVTLILTVFLDRLVVGLIPYSLIYPPNAVITYQTAEFECVAHTNNLGFRGPAFSLDPFHNKFRVITLGDSFTYGWGVGEEETWSSALSRQLTEGGASIQIANLGWVGKGPTDYANLAEKAVPLLKPDLIIVAILMGDDIQQVKAVEKAPEVESFSVIVFQKLYPHLSEKLLQPYDSKGGLDNYRKIAAEGLPAYWQSLAQAALQRMSPDELRRFESLAPEIKENFQAGLINPSLVYLAMHHPGYFLESVEITAPEIRQKINQLARELERIKKVAADHQAKVMVVAVPYGTYVSERYMNNSRRLGFAVAPEMLSSAPDDVIASAARQAGLPFVSVLDSFKRHQGQDLFFEQDGHFTAAGQKLLADNLRPVVVKEYGQWLAR